MFIPGEQVVGGFSMCSSPNHLTKTGELSLCVKRSDHPPAEWVHNSVSLKIYFSAHILFIVVLHRRAKWEVKSPFVWEVIFS